MLISVEQYSSTRPQIHPRPDPGSGAALSNRAVKGTTKGCKIALRTMHCTVNSNSTLHTTHCTLHTAHYTLNEAHWDKLWKIEGQHGKIDRSELSRATHFEGFAQLVRLSLFHYVYL